MKAALIKLFILPSGITLLVVLSVLSLILLHTPLEEWSPQARRDRDTFPDQRRGGGTHWVIPEDHVA